MRVRKNLLALAQERRKEKQKEETKILEQAQLALDEINLVKEEVLNAVQSSEEIRVEALEDNQIDDRESGRIIEVKSSSAIKHQS